MKMEDNKKIVQVIQTTKGHILSPYSNSQTKVSLTIFNELLVPESAKHKINIPLDLEHLAHHKMHPYSLENTSIAWASLQHELRELLAKTSSSQSNVLIFESSNYNEKIPQIFNRFQIVKGFNYRIKLESFENISEDKIVLMNEEHVLKQIEMEFSLGNGTFKPGYIGEINFEEIESPILSGIIKAYVNYAARTRCPIVINFAHCQGQETYNVVFEEHSKELIESFQRKLSILNDFLVHAKQMNCSKNIIIYNLPILIIHKKNYTNPLNYFEKHIQRILSEFNVTVGFKLLRYSKFNEKEGINQIIKLVQKYPNNIILSSGIKYKTDLTVNSGQGLTLYNYSKSCQTSSILHLNSIQYMKHFLPHQTLDRVIRQNILELFDWKGMKEQIKIQVFWKCDNCKGDFSQNVQAFQKFGKRLCSIKCLKSFKF